MKIQYFTLYCITNVPINLKLNLYQHLFRVTLPFINDIKYQKDNQKWTIQRNLQHRVHDEGNQTKNTPHYVLYITARKQAQITYLRHEPSYNQLG